MKTAIAIGLLACAAFSGANAAGFDCSKASTNVEKRICANPELDALDTELNQVYKEVAVYPGIKESQRKWVREMRNSSETDALMTMVYQLRIIDLKRFKEEQETIVHPDVTIVKKPATPVEPEVKKNIVNGMEVDEDGFYIVQQWTVSQDYDVAAYEVKSETLEFSHIALVNYFGAYVPMMMGYTGEIEEDMPVYLTVNGRRVAFSVIENEDGDRMLFAPSYAGNEQLVKSLSGGVLVINGEDFDTHGFKESLKMMIENQAL